MVLVTDAINKLFVMINAQANRMPNRRQTKKVQEAFMSIKILEKYVEGME